MHEIVVEQPLCAIARMKPPKPASSSLVHSAFRMRQGPADGGTGTVAESVTLGGAMATGCCSVEVQPDNTAPSAAAMISTLTTMPPNPEEIVGGTRGVDQSASSLRRLQDAQDG